MICEVSAERECTWAVRLDFLDLDGVHFHVLSMESITFRGTLHSSCGEKASRVTEEVLLCETSGEHLLRFLKIPIFYIILRIILVIKKRLFIQNFKFFKGFVHN